MLFETDEFRGVRRGFNRTDRFADALGLHEHQILGKVLFVLFEVVGNLVSSGMTDFAWVP